MVASTITPSGGRLICSANVSARTGICSTVKSSTYLVVYHQSMCINSHPGAERPEGLLRCDKRAGSAYRDRANFCSKLFDGPGEHHSGKRAPKLLQSFQSLIKNRQRGQSLFVHLSSFVETFGYNPTMVRIRSNHLVLSPKVKVDHFACAGRPGVPATSVFGIGPCGLKDIVPSFHRSTTRCGP